MKSFNFKQYLTVEMVESPFPQSLGRLFRVGQHPVVVVPFPTVESEVCRKIESEIIVLGDCGSSTGVSFHLDIFPKPDITHKYDFDI